MKNWPRIFGPACILRESRPGACTTGSGQRISEWGKFIPRGEHSVSAIEVLHLRTTAERYSVVPKSYSLCHTWQAAADFTVVSGPFQRRTLLRLAQTFTAVAVPWQKSGQRILTKGRIEEEAPSPPKKNYWSLV